MLNANISRSRLLVRILCIVSVLCLKNLYDAVHYATLHAPLSSTQIETEIDSETGIEKETKAGSSMTSIGQISNAIENEGATNNNAAQEQSERRAHILASGSDILSPVTDNSPLVWHPSNEWVKNCVQDFSSQTEADGEWDVISRIALGDCIKFCRCYHGNHPNTTFNKIYFGKTCPLTFPSPKNGATPGNFSLSVIDEVHEIQRHYPNFTIPEPEALVMHLRLGDILEEASSNVTELLISGGDPGYRPNGHFRNSIKSIHELLDNVHSSKAKTVHIVGGSHKKEFWRKSRVYAGCLHRAIETAGYNTTMRLEGTHPDIDFYYISHARQMVVSAGGYSNLMGQLVEYRGGKIIGRSFGVSW